MHHISALTTGPSTFSHQWAIYLPIQVSHLPAHYSWPYTSPHQWSIYLPILVNNLPSNPSGNSVSDTKSAPEYYRVDGEPSLTQGVSESTLLYLIEPFSTQSVHKCKQD